MAVFFASGEIMVKTIIIGEEYSNITVKDYIRKHLGYSDRNLKSLKYKGGIIVDGNDVNVNFKLEKGMMLTLEFPDENSDGIIPENIPIDVIFEDDEYLAVNKPHNMPVHPSYKHQSGTLANAIMYYFKDEAFVFRPLTRLDIDTSGVVIIAKNAVAASRFGGSKPEKQYVAICVGCPEPKNGEIDAPIGRDAGIIKRCVRDDGKPSLTKYRVLKEGTELCLLEAIPVTGRTHQIRVHLSHIGCPIYADYLYGEEIKGERTRLHCRQVRFEHPFTGEIITLCAPVPDDFIVLEKDMI